MPHPAEAQVASFFISHDGIVLLYDAEGHFLGFDHPGAEHDLRKLGVREVPRALPQPQERAEEDEDC